MANSDLRKSTIAVDEIVARYQAGESSSEIAKLAGVSDRQIRRLINREGAQTRSAGKTPIHDVSTAFFKSWSNEMAYVLGFIVTDGCVTDNQLVIAQKERYILERIAKVVGTTAQVSEFKNNGGKSVINRLCLSRKEIVHDLNKLGITKRKSLTVPFPDVPDEFMSHFFRGVIDGDGWVHKKGYVMSIASASLQFAERATETLIDHKFRARLVVEPRTDGATLYRPTVSGKDDIRRLGEWLYRDCSDLYLARKRERFEYHCAA